MKRQTQQATRNQKKVRHVRLVIEKKFAQCFIIFPMCLSTIYCDVLLPSKQTYGRISSPQDTLPPRLASSSSSAVFCIRLHDRVFRPHPFPWILRQHPEFNLRLCASWEFLFASMNGFSLWCDLCLSISTLIISSLLSMSFTDCARRNSFSQPMPMAREERLLAHTNIRRERRVHSHDRNVDSDVIQHVWGRERAKTEKRSRQAKPPKGLMRSSKNCVRKRIVKNLPLSDLRRFMISSDLLLFFSP